MPLVNTGMTALLEAARGPQGDFYNLLFCQLDLPPLDAARCIAEVEAAFDAALLIHDRNRNFSILPIYTFGGKDDPATFFAEHGDMRFTDFAMTHLPYLCSYIDEAFLSWMRPHPRCNLLYTPPFEHGFPHIDCGEERMGSHQHKIRFAIRGDTTRLAFVTEAGDAFVPATVRPYVMDGSFPHVMRNTHDQRRFVMALGNPWQGQHDAVYHALLERSIHAFPNTVMLRSDHVMWSEYRTLFTRR